MAPATERIVLIYTTFGNLDDAERCGKALVECQLAGCVNILPRMISIYEWQGHLDRDEEVVMLIKTRDSKADIVRVALERMHPYDTPAILTIATTHVNADYAAWLIAQTEGD